VPDIENSNNLFRGMEYTALTFHYLRCSTDGGKMIENWCLVNKKKVV